MTENHKNSLDKEIEEITEWQENRFNPGYYIGTGRMPKPLLSLCKYPKLIIAFGVICVIPVPFIVKGGLNKYENVIGFLFSLFFSGAFLYGGISRLLQRKK